MTIAQCKEQVLRIKAASGFDELNQQLEEKIRREVVETVQAVLEESLQSEINEHLERLGKERPRRSGSYTRGLSTQYGQIESLRVPKLRCRNREREWRVLTRYSRCLPGLLDYASYLYVMGLSLRDLQEALYLLMGKLFSRSVVNQVTLRVEERMRRHRQSPIAQSPFILIVDGVWVEIQYSWDEYKLDRAGHRRQRRQAEERVILAAMAVWPDGNHQLLHYRVGESEDTPAWTAFFTELIDRQVDPQAIELVVSDGSKGLLEAVNRCFPRARQQRCIAHKVRGMERHLTYDSLPETDQQGHTLSESEAKRLRRFQIQQDAYAIYDAPSLGDAQSRFTAFVDKWHPIEPTAVRSFAWGGKRTFEFYRFPSSLRPLIATTNLLERFFREFRTKADEIGAFPNEDSCLTLFFLVLQREHAKHDRFHLANNS